MNTITILGVPGVWQIAIIAIVVLIIFGGKKIPEMMKGLGSGIKEFKDAVKEEDKVQVDPVSPMNSQTTTPLNPVTPQVDPTPDNANRPTDSAGNTL